MSAETTPPIRFLPAARRRSTGALAVAGLMMALIGPAAANPAADKTGSDRSALNRDAGTGDASGHGAAADGASASAGPRAKAPKDKRTQLEGLFAALKVAPDERSARLIADRLEQLFNSTDSASVDLLTARATVALEAKDYDVALRLLDQALQIDPDDIGALAKRASIYYMRDDYGPALADIREILAREPRHFTVLLGFAMILRDIGDEKHALEAARKALEVNPRLEGAQEMVTQLSLTVEGREI